MKQQDGQEQAPYQLLLFVAGKSGLSVQAEQNIKEICEEYLDGGCDLQVINIYQNPDLVSKYEVLAVPTLIKVFPSPQRRIMGDLSQREEVLAQLAM